MALVAWLTVLSGTFVIYPWYRSPANDSPRSLLLSSPATAEWHKFGMEWKEHVGWIAPLLATSVAYIVSKYGPRLAYQDKLRQAAMWMFVLAFAAAGIAGIFGAFLNKAAPIR